MLFIIAVDILGWAGNSHADLGVALLPCHSLDEQRCASVRLNHEGM